MVSEVFSSFLFHIETVSLECFQFLKRNHINKNTNVSNLLANTDRYSFTILISFGVSHSILFTVYWLIATASVFIVIFQVNVGFWVKCYLIYTCRFSLQSNFTNRDQERILHFLWNTRKKIVIMSILKSGTDMSNSLANIDLDLSMDVNVHDTNLPHYNISRPCLDWFTRENMFKIHSLCWNLHFTICFLQVTERHLPHVGKYV